jgi:hypothetical protein
MLPMLEEDIADLVLDIDPIRRIFLAIKDNLTSSLAEALLPILNIEDQAPKVKKAQRDLTDREALTVRKNFNKQEAKDLAQLIDNLKNSPTRIEIELNQVRAKHVDHDEVNLIQIPDVIIQKKQEMLTKVKEGKAICSSLATILGSTKEDKQRIAEVDALWLKALEAIQGALSF